MKNKKIEKKKKRKSKTIKKQSNKFNVSIHDKKKRKKKGSLELNGFPKKNKKRMKEKINPPNIY